MNEILTIFYAMLPINELRGTIPLVISWGISPEKALILAIIGNFIPVPILILGLNKITKLAQKYSPFLTRILNWVFKCTRKKTEKTIQKYGNLALFLFVAIPLPFTGAWTGSIATWLFNIPFKKAWQPILLGIITAGLIVTFISIGLFSWFKL